MKIVNMHEAKSTLSQLVEQVMNGERIFLARNGTPVAMIVPLAESAGLRPIGLNAMVSPETSDSALFSPMTAEELAAWNEDDTLCAEA